MHTQNGGIGTVRYKFRRWTEAKTQLDRRICLILAAILKIIFEKNEQFAALRYLVYQIETMCANETKTVRFFE